jgi:hypothetical protein
LVIVLEMGSDGGNIMRGLPSDDGDSALDSYQPPIIPNNEDPTYNSPAGDITSPSML